MSPPPAPYAAPAPWGTYDLGTEAEIRLRLGALDLTLGRRDGELHVGREVVSTTDPGRSTGSRSWTRWAPAQWDGRVSITPIFPDRLVVVRPASELWLLRGAEARIFVPVPLWVHLEALGPHPASLARIPTVVQSDTWWGTFENGELCYWLETPAGRSPDDSLFEPHLAVCPLHLLNPFADSLPVEKIALRVSHLSLYAEGPRLWSDEMRVSYQGETEGAELEVGGEPPREGRGGRLVLGPRMKMTRGFRTLTFAKLRSLQGWL
jgi:hypothetical protein